LNDAAEVALAPGMIGGSPGICRGFGGPVTQIVRAGDSLSSEGPSFTGLDRSLLNNAGAVAKRRLARPIVAASLAATEGLRT
jgi:hypothetical protein